MEIAPDRIEHSMQPMLVDKKAAIIKQAWVKSGARYAFLRIGDHFCRSFLFTLRLLVLVNTYEHAMGGMRRLLAAGVVVFWGIGEGKYARN